MEDITFRKENCKFNFRVACIFTFENKILIQKAEKDDYYSLIGGRVKFLETSKEALIREIKEELNFDVTDKNLVLARICENFFAHNETNFHELLYIYLISLDKNDEIVKKEKFACSDKEQVEMLWIDQQQIKDIDLRPKLVEDVLENSKLQQIILK